MASKADIERNIASRAPIAFLRGAKQYEPRPKLESQVATGAQDNQAHVHQQLATHHHPNPPT